MIKKEMTMQLAWILTGTAAALLLGRALWAAGQGIREAVKDHHKSKIK